MSRTRGVSRKLSVRLLVPDLRQLDTWRRARRVRTRSAAIRILVRLALRAGAAR